MTTLYLPDRRILAPLPNGWRFTIPGVPRTKKTSNRIIYPGRHNICPACARPKGRPFVAPSANWMKWLREVRQYMRTKPELVLRIARPVNVRALFYRDRAIGDVAGFIQGLGDILQECEIVENDKWIESWDGTRRLKDAADPRTEVEITWAT